MSIPESQRGEGRFAVLIKAQQLAIYTIKICCNKNVFLPEYQSALTDDIIRTAKNIFIRCWTANNIRVGSDGEKRRERRRLQEQAANDCNNLLALMQMAQTLFHLKLKRIKYWGQNTLEVRGLIRGWIESDTKRYSKEQ